MPRKVTKDNLHTFALVGSFDKPTLGFTGKVHTPLGVTTNLDNKSDKRAVYLSLPKGNQGYDSMSYVVLDMDNLYNLFDDEMVECIEPDGQMSLSNYINEVRRVLPVHYSPVLKKHVMVLGYFKGGYMESFILFYDGKNLYHMKSDSESVSNKSLPMTSILDKINN